MATFTATAAQSTAPAFYNVNGATTRVVKYTHPVALSAGDVIQMLKVPNGAVVTSLAYGVSASAGAITVNLGDGNDTSAYAASIVLSATQLNVMSTFRGMGRSYSAEDTIDFVVTVVSAAPGTVDLYLKLDYTNQNGN